MANGWTPERRARQSELIKNWRPWEKSTGAKTKEGKLISSGNSLKHGIYSSAAMTLQRKLIQILIDFGKNPAK